MMQQPLKRCLCLVAAATTLAGLTSGCNQSTPPDANRITVAAADEAIPSPPAGLPPSLTDAQLRGESGAELVLQQWATALERGDYDRSYAQFGDAGAASGMSRARYAERWSQFKHIDIAAGPGVMEGAAGTSYYTAPVELSARRADGTIVKRSGKVTLARVNDVPGATPAQLRWHLVTSELSKSL